MRITDRLLIHTAMWLDGLSEEMNYLAQQVESRVSPDFWELYAAELETQLFNCAVSKPSVRFIDKMLGGQ